MDAVGAGRESRVGQNRPAALARDHNGDLAITRRHDHGPDLSRDRMPPDMQDHRRSGDVGERLSRQPRRGEPGRDQDDGAFRGGGMVHAEQFGGMRRVNMPASCERRKRHNSPAQFG